MSKTTILHVLDMFGHAVDPRVGAAIDAGKAIAHAGSDVDRSAAIIEAVNEGLQVAGDYSGKDALGDPALQALLDKYIRDGFELRAFIDAKKKAAAAVAALPSAPVASAQAGSSSE